MWERLFLYRRLLALAVPFVLVSASGSLFAQVTALRAGRLIDPETGTSAANQIILVEDGKIRAVGANVDVPAGAETIDLSGLSVLPGLVDTQTISPLPTKKASPAISVDPLEGETATV